MLNDKNIHDYMGRRIAKKLFENNVLVSSEKFVYDGYLQVATLNSTNAISRLIYWDPSETIATRPLMISLANSGTFFPTVDLTKNICELINVNLAIATTYDYTPFGAVSISGTHSSPFQFSSEFTDSELGLVYYNYRHYNPTDGRWINRDPIESELSSYSFIVNNTTGEIDLLGESRKNKRPRRRQRFYNRIILSPLSASGDFITLVFETIASFHSYNNAVEQGIMRCQIESPNQPPVINPDAGPIFNKPQCRCCVVSIELVVSVHSLEGPHIYRLAHAAVENKRCDDLIEDTHIFSKQDKRKDFIQEHFPWY